MDMSISDRVRGLLAERDVERKYIAAAVGMTMADFSRAVDGQRGFGSLELSKVAEALDVDLHWLITGREDPFRVRVAARHTYDHGARAYQLQSEEADRRTLDDIRLAYQQGFRDAIPPSHLPSGPAEVREAILAAGGFRHFADVLEERFDVDVVRLRQVENDWSFRIAERGVVVLQETANWFYENWSLAHELGHLAHGHHDAGPDNEAAEREANAFAAEVLLPAEEMDRLRDVDDAATLGELVWEWGVSTTAVATRASSIGVPLHPRVKALLELTTVDLLRHHSFPRFRHGEITDRRRDATARRFPTALIEAHEQAVADGRLGRGTLAWMLGIDEEDVEVRRPPDPPSSFGKLASILGPGPA